ncbi:MAG: ABC transporter transmembrane domain-containing protein [Pseudonocardiaceae bacterium]
MLYAAVQVLVTGSGTDLVTLGLIATGAAIGRFVLWGRAMFVSHIAGGNVLRQLRMSLAQRLARLPLGYFDRRHSGEVTKVLADDIERLELFLAHAIPEFISAVGVWLAVTGWLLIVDWRLALASIAVVPVAAVLVRRSLAGSSGYIATVSAAAARMNAAVVELLDGLPVVKVFGRNATASRRSRQAVDDCATAETAWSRAALPLSTAAEVLAP